MRMYLQYKCTIEECVFEDIIHNKYKNNYCLFTKTNDSLVKT